MYRKLKTQRERSRPLTLSSIAILGLLSGLAFAGCSDDDKPTDSQTSVSYAADVQPIFDANCTDIGCHTVPFPAEGLNLTIYDSLAASNTDDHIFVAGDADSSELIKRLTGESTPQMPLNKDPLDIDQIETIRTWINEGALDN